MRIDVCICTFRRPFVTRTLASVDAARRPAGADLRIIVIDNDDTPSAHGRIQQAAYTLSLEVQYFHVPGSNISIARNATLDRSDADWIAFVDDDEVVEPDWLVALMARQVETEADAVFGHSLAIYAPDAPDWMVEGNFHSQFAVLRGQIVETGHTCNALLRWRGTHWRDERFALDRGRSGGEDTEFFFRLRAMGACYAIANASIVHENIPQARLRLSWLLKRRFRIGQSYASSASGVRARSALFAMAAIKALYCASRAIPVFGDLERRAFWLMRATMHAGVCGGCMNLSQRALYGSDA